MLPKSSAAQERTEHWGDKRQVALGWPVDESLLNEKSQYGDSSLLLTWRRWRRSSIVEASPLPSAMAFSTLCSRADARR